MHTLKTKLIMACLLLATALHAQYATIQDSSSPANSVATLNAKLAFTIQSEQPSTCVRGKDIWIDSDDGKWYACTTTDAFSEMVLTGQSYANPAWITSLAYAKITGVPAFLTAVTAPNTSTLGGIFSGQCTTTTGKLMGYDTSGVRICESDQTSGGGSGITTFNTLTGATQTLAVTNDTNVTASWGSSGTTHTLVLNWTGALAKARQHANTLYSDSSLGAFPTFNQDTTGTSGGLSGTALTGDASNSGNAVTVGGLLGETLVATPGAATSPTGSCAPMLYTGTINGAAVAALGAVTSGSITIATLTGDFRPDYVELRERTAFASVTTLTTSMGRSTNTTTQVEWIPTFSLMVSGGQNKWVDRPAQPTDGVGNTYAMAVTFTSTGGNLSAATAGVLVWEIKGCFVGVAQ